MGGNCTIFTYPGPSRHRARPSVQALWQDPLPDALTRATLLSRCAALAMPRAPWMPVLDCLEALSDETRGHGILEIAGPLAIVFQNDRFPDPLDWHIAPERDGTRLIVDTNEIALGEPALQQALKLAHSLFHPDPATTNIQDNPKRSAALDDFLTMQERRRLDPNTRMLVETALARGIPVHRPLNTLNMIHLGHGVKRQRMVEATTDCTSAIAVKTLQADKVLTLRILAEAGVPTPQQIPAPTKERLQEAVKAIGFPLVIKGRRGAKGETVTAAITRLEEIPPAVQKATKAGAQVIVERHLPGDDYRLTVVGGKMVAAARREAAHVVGDGQQTVKDLMIAENKRRSTLTRHSYWIVPLRLDEDCRTVLAQDGLSPDSIPKKGRYVRLRRVSNFSKGALSIDVTDQVHPNVKAMAERAARVVGLNIAGLDLITTDISRPLSETRGGFIEINAYAGMRAHYIADPQQDVAGAILNHLYPDGDDGRIPTVAVTGTNGKTTTVRMIRMILREAGLITASCTSADARIGDDLISRSDCAGGGVAQRLMRDSSVQAGVFELARGAMIKRGSVLDRWSIGIVTNLSEDHMGLDGIETLEDMASVKSLIVRHADRAVVLNADNPYCAAMHEKTDRPIWWVSMSADHPRIADHVEAGGNAVILKEMDGQEQIVWRHEGTETPILPIREAPATHDGAARFNVENALAATAGALALGHSPQDVARGLRAFTTSYDDNPGRLNMRRVKGVTLINDYGHNPDGFTKALDFVDRQECTGRRIGVVIRPMDRQSKGFDGEAAALAGRLDHLHVAIDRRSRPGPAAALDDVLDALKRHDAQMETVTGHPGALEALHTAFATLKDGDVLYVSSGDYHEIWREMQTYDGPPADRTGEERS